MKRQTGNSSSITAQKYVGKLEQNLLFRHFIFAKVSGYGNMNKNTLAQQLAFTHAFIEETGGDPAKV